MMFLMGDFSDLDGGIERAPPKQTETPKSRHRWGINQKNRRERVYLGHGLQQ